MGLFGSGVLRKQIDELAVQIETMRRELESVKSERSELRKELSAQETLVRSAKESRKKIEKKLEKATAARTAADQKAASHLDQIGYLEKELATYRQEIKTIRSDLEKTRAELAKAGPKIIEKVNEEQPPSTQAPANIEPQVETPRPPRNDRRLERLEEQLEQEKAFKQSLKDRVNRAEKLGRDAERRRMSDLNRAEAVLRDLRHSLRSERRAYKVLQLQFEAMRARAIEGLPYEEPSLPPMAIAADEASTPPRVIDVRDSITEEPDGESELDESHTPVQGADAADASSSEGGPTTDPTIEDAGIADPVAGAEAKVDDGSEAITEDEAAPTVEAATDASTAASTSTPPDDPIRPRRRIVDTEG